MKDPAAGKGPCTCNTLGRGGGKQPSTHRVQQKLTHLCTSPHAETRMQTVEKKFHTALKKFVQTVLVMANAMSKKDLSRLEKQLVCVSEFFKTL